MIVRDAEDPDPRHRLVVAEVGAEVVGTLQLSFLPHLVRRGGERAQLEAVRVAAEGAGWAGSSSAGPSTRPGPGGASWSS